MSEWNEFYLSDVGTLARGKSKHRPRWADHLYGGPYPFIQTGDISAANKYINTYRQTYSEAGLAQSKLWDKGTLCITIAANIAEIAILELPACFPDSVLGFIPNPEKVDLNFVFYTLTFLKARIQNLAIGSVQENINLGTFKNIKFFFPSVKKQKEIASVLSCLDRKIENLRKQNDTLEAIAQTLFKHWFVDFEFPNADGKPYKSSGGAMEPSELGEIPAGWRVGKLGDVVKVNAESISKSYQHKEIEYVDISSVGIGVLEGTTSYLFKNAPSRARRLVKHGDVIWSGVRPNRKSYLFISHPPENLVVSTGFITLTPDSIPSSYLYSWVTTESFVEYLTFNASGSAYPAIKAEHFEIADVLLPDKFNLTKFHAVIEPMREKIHQNSRQLQTLTKTRDLLLPKLMSGKLRIKP
ncbi:Type I restriction modification DNA specificity domain protein [Coleofasciculus chthonoplastes PCC 7420]|uniref:Type I restriction modification DNA specificity domain protein n=1 Tax=Coleofasciculus chthonoplastes PCC 7420 TaxID=118168 RepID=B4VWN0_9CYAN|nr:restriction endonuclease subunit S [Coleofasciculus chthonoplastes]EDX73621.1 Type I restriction modification DNA specificity domain protein [Coleofasciculus chthonoplastes PCC 7420]